MMADLSTLARPYAKAAFDYFYQKLLLCKNGKDTYDTLSTVKKLTGKVKLGELPEVKEVTIEEMLTWTT